MRIVVNDIAATSGGGLAVLESFYRFVREQGGEHEWVFLLGSDLLDEAANVRTIVLPDVKRSWLRRLRFDLASGRRLISSLKPDVVFSLQNTYTYGVSAPQVVYVHQSLPFQRARTFSILRRDERKLAIYQYIIGAIIKLSIQSADHVIVQTEWMRDAILDQVRITPDRVTSVLPDLDDVSAYKFDGPSDPGSFFYPTSNHAYKNNDCIYAACRLLRQQGAVDFRVTMTLDPPSRDPNVAAIGRISRGQVLKRLSRSTLVFPSYIETYGVPLAEARSLGSLILAADCPYSREVLRGYENAYYFDPFSPEQLADLMQRVIVSGIVRSGGSDQSGEPSPASGPAWGKVIALLQGTRYKERTL